MENLNAWLQQNLWAVILISIWDVGWKLVSMWYAARLAHKIWFVVLLLVNSIGILPILYLFVVAKVRFWEKTPSKPVVVEAEVVKKRKKS